MIIQKSFITFFVGVFASSSSSWWNDGHHGHHAGWHQHHAFAQEQEHGTIGVHGGHPNHGGLFGLVAGDPLDPTVPSSDVKGDSNGVGIVVGASMDPSAVMSGDSDGIGGDDDGVTSYDAVDGHINLVDPSSFVMIGGMGEGVGNSVKGATTSDGGGRFVPDDPSSSLAGSGGKVLDHLTVSFIDDIVDPLSVKSSQVKSSHPDDAMFVKADSDRLLKSRKLKSKGSKKNKSKKEVDLSNSSDDEEVDFPNSSDDEEPDFPNSSDENRNVTLSEGDENLKKISDGIALTSEFADLIQSFPSDSSSAAEVMGYFGNVANVIGNFVPGFMIVGQVLHQFTGFLGIGPPPVVPPEYQVEFDKLNEKLDAIDSKLDIVITTLREGFKKIGDQICSSALDKVVADHIGNIDNEIRYLKRATNPIVKKAHYDDIKSLCKSHPPRRIIGELKRIILREHSTDCFALRLDLYDNRVGIYRKTFVPYVLDLMIKGVHFHGICMGLPDSDESSMDNRELFDGDFKKVYQGVMDADEKIYAKSPAASWIETVNAPNHIYKNLASDELYAALKNDFFPDYQYGIVELNGDASDAALASYQKSEETENLYGSFMVGKNKIVFYTTRAFANSNSALTQIALPPWKNENCPASRFPWGNGDVCLWYCNHKDHHGCNNAKQLTDTMTGKNSPIIEKEYRERGVVLIRVQNQIRRRVRGTGGYYWVWSDVGGKASFGGQYGDPIYRFLSTGWEGRNNSKNQKNSPRAEFRGVGIGVDLWTLKPRRTLIENQAEQRWTTSSVSRVHWKESNDIYYWDESINILSGGHVGWNLHLAFDWKDQGYGNQLGEFAIELIDNGDTRMAIQTWSLRANPRTNDWTTLTATLDNTSELVQRVISGAHYRVSIITGGGGGHKLYIKNFKLEVTDLPPMLTLIENQAEQRWTTSSVSPVYWKESSNTLSLGTDMKLHLAFDWKDQGWGNQLGAFVIELFNNGGTRLAVQTWALRVNPRAGWTPSRSIFDETSELVQRVIPGAYYRVSIITGGGGGHELYIKNFKLEVSL